jgi:hypothetical protein
MVLPHEEAEGYGGPEVEPSLMRGDRRPVVVWKQVRREEEEERGRLPRFVVVAAGRHTFLRPAAEDIVQAERDPDVGRMVVAGYTVGRMKFVG